MIRDVDLVSYLPPFIAEFQEISATLTAENPEFKIAWETADRVLKNEFIATADEYGISRFERILKIYPSAGDTLEVRRARVQARWVVFTPYTLRWLKEWFEINCGPETYKISVSDYTIDIQLDYDVLPDAANLAVSLWEVLDTVIPANMVLSVIPVSTSFMNAYAAAVPMGCEMMDGAMAECY